ncbi:MAG TPA: biotin-dependent carboxyltransferase family protein [Burkholderiaceae bacterium]
MSFEILKPGVLTTVQDGGRRGVAHLGVPRGGALDLPALMLANRLVGNDEHAAGLEIVAGPVAIRLFGSGWLALCGADFGARLDGVALAPGWRRPWRDGQMLELSGTRHGMRCYLALSGGVHVPLVLGSRSTDLGAGFGGWQGRALHAGDRLPLGAGAHFERAVGCLQPESDGVLRYLAGPEMHHFGAKLDGGVWTVTPQSNRMGMRLTGPKLQRDDAAQLPSHAVIPGVIQVPPDGQPIVLLADAQTTGGYPRIGVVIEADLWKLAQARPKETLRFVQCDAAQAASARAQIRQSNYRFNWSADAHRS